ncbi:TPA: helix-turn-helix domain-containing protein [Kluyvera ascorbata]|nr:helix-turn-helix domain-containing protein [Kluyvera ascorbata]
MSQSDDSSRSLHAFEFSQKTKPLKTIMALHSILAPFGSAFTLNPSAKMLLSNDRETAFIVLVTTGCFSVSHAQVDLHMATVFAPTVVGLIDGYSLYYDVPARPQHYIRAETECTGWIIPLDTFVEKCDEFNLWHDIARILAQRVMVMSARDSEMVGNDAYSKIRSLLMELWLYPEDIRRQIKVSSFIQRRTRISRSRIMDVLAELKKGHYIEVQSGVLVYMDKLPTAF